MTTNTQESVNRLWRDDKHDHFWIEDEKLFETYRTIRGLRWRYRMDVPGFQNFDRLDEKQIDYIERIYL